MAEISEILELLRFELKFLEDGGYGRFPSAPWRARFIFEDSPTCLNFGDPSRTIPCSECILTQFVPEELKAQRVPCRHIPLTEKGETIEQLYHHGTQGELEDALKGWLRKEIAALEVQNGSGVPIAPSI
jgi:hypothetical protein